MADIDALLNEVEEADLKIAFGDLEVGIEYKVRSLQRTSTQMRDKTIPGMLCRIASPDQLNMFTYLPKTYLNMKDALFNKINSDAEAGNHWSVVFYGSVGNGNVGRLHKPGAGMCCLCSMSCVNILIN